MIKRTFLEFVQTRQGDHKTEPTPGSDDLPITSKITLGDGNDLPPLMVSDDPNSQYYGKNKGLAVLIRAFKKGGNWGWTRDDKSGEDKPVKMGSKKLFMTGGAVRDHLAGKTPRNIELATNASPDEIYNILTQNKFKFIGDNTNDNLSSGNKMFWVKSSNKNGRPISFGVRINNDEYDLSVFIKSSHDTNGLIMEPGTQAEDAAARDFTINAMSLALTNDNGPNKDLYDFYGGLHHLVSGKVLSIGNFQRKLEQDPLRILRYARMLNRYGGRESVPEQDKVVIQNALDSLGAANRQDIADEFMKGLAPDDIDPRRYLMIHNDLGTLPLLFPNLQLDTELPIGLRELGDKHAALAWLLRNEPCECLQSMFDRDGWKPEDARKILFLVKSNQALNNDLDAQTLNDLVQSYLQSGLSSRKVKSWATKLGGKNDGLVNAFLQHAHSPRVDIFTADNGIELDDGFSDLVDPFTGELQAESEATARKHRLEWENFQKLLQIHAP